MHKRILLGCYLILSSGSAGQCREDNAQQSSPTPFVLVDPAKSPVVFSWTQLKNGSANVVAFNSSAVEIKVTASLTPLDPFPIDSSSTTPLPIVVSPPSVTPIASLHSQSFALRLSQTAAPLPGTYAGLLVVQDISGKTAPFTQEVRVTVDGPQPLVPKVTVTMWRLFPLGDDSPWCGQDVSIPLRDPHAAEALHGALVGALRNDAGGWTRVRWKETVQSASNPNIQASPTQAVPLLFVDPPPAAGKYEGDLTLSRDPEKASLTLTVIAKDNVVPPILVIVVGTYLAFVVKRYLGVKRITWSLREKEAELGDAYRKSATQFRDISRGQSFATYSISADVEAKRQEILDHLTAIEKSWATSIASDNTDYTAACSLLQSLQSGIAAWPSLAEGLAALSSAFQLATNEIDGSLMEPTTTDPGSPTFFEQVNDLLQGRAIPVVNLPQLSANVAAATALTVNWTKAVTNAVTITGKVRETKLPPKATDEQKTDFEALRDLTAALWVHLWGIRSSADLDNILGPGGDFDSVNTHFAQMKIELPSIRPRKLTTPSMAGSGELAEVPLPSWFSNISEALSTPDDSERATSFRAAIFRYDLASTLFAGAIGLLTGLNLFYLGKPFGTFQDYVALLLWAAGTKAALDVVVAVLDKLVSPLTH